MEESRLVKVFDMLVDRLNTVENTMAEMKAATVHQNDSSPAGSVFSGRLHCSRDVTVTKHYNNMLQKHQYLAVVVDTRRELLHNHWWPSRKWANGGDDPHPFVAKLERALGPTRYAALRSVFAAFYAGRDPKHDDECCCLPCGREITLPPSFWVPEGSSIRVPSTNVFDCMAACVIGNEVPEVVLVSAYDMVIKFKEAPVGDDNSIRVADVLQVVAKVCAAIGTSADVVTGVKLYQMCIADIPLMAAILGDSDSRIREEWDALGKTRQDLIRAQKSDDHSMWSEWWYALDDLEAQTTS